MHARFAPETLIAALLAALACGVALWAALDGNLAKAVALFWPLAGVSVVALLLGAMRRVPDDVPREAASLRDPRRERETIKSWAD